MAFVEIYDKFGDHIESHEILGTFNEWLADTAPDYNPAVPLFWATIEGKTFDFDDDLGDSVVIVTMEPQATAVVVAVIAIIAAAYAYYIASNIPAQYQKSYEDGDSIYSPNARANQVRPSGIIREIAGSPPVVYPDLICAPRRKYINNEEYLYLMLCIGRGYHEVGSSNFHIAETPIVNYAGDYTLNIYEPGDDVTGNEAHENWFQSSEVLNLKLTTQQTEIVGDWTVDYSGATITSYLDGSAAGFPFSVGEKFQIIGGTNPGYYEVVSISGGANEVATVDELARDLDSLNITIQQTNRQSEFEGRVRRVSFTTVGAASFSAATGENANWLSVNGGVNWNGPYQPIPAGETARYLELDFNFRNGLGRLDANNEIVSASVQIIAQWRAIGESAWNTETYTYNESTFDELGFTETIDCGSAIRPEIRIRRVTEDSGDVARRDEVFFKRLKSLLTTATSYPDVTTAALILRGTNTLAQTSENKINIRGLTRKLPTLTQIQNAIAGTPFDLSRATTEVEVLYSLNGASFVSSVNITDDYNQPVTTANTVSVHLSSDGLKMLVYEDGVCKIFTLDTAYRPDNGLTYDGYFSAASSIYNFDAQFGNSGSKVVVLRKQSDPSVTYYLTDFDLSTAYDPSTASVGSDFNLGAEISDGQSVCFRSNGTRCWVADGDGQIIEQYTLSTAWGVSTASRDVVTFDFSTDLGDNTADSTLDLKGIWLDDYSGSEPTKMWALRRDGVIFAYSLATAGDITSAELDASYTLEVESGFSDVSFYISANHAYLAVSISNTASVNVYTLEDIVDSASTRSLVRYAANVLYSDIGDSVDTLIDWSEMATLDTLLDGRSDYLDMEFVDETTLWEAMKVMFAPGYTEPTIKEGKLFPVRIASTSTYVNLYTPDIMLDGVTRSGTFYEDTDPDGVDVEYIDEDSGEIEVVECRLTGDLGLRPKTIRALGIKNRDRAWRYGMRERRRLFYKPASYAFETELDGLNSNYGQFDAIASDLFASQCGEVVSVSGSDVTLDFEPVFGAGTHFAAFRNREGEMSGLYTVVAGPSANQITLSSPTTLDFTPVTDGSMDSTMVTFGASDEWGERVIIRNIEPNGTETCSITAEEYVEAIFADDNNTAP